MSEFWAPIIVGGVIGFGLKFAGYSVPESVIGRPVVRRVAALLPVALLSALTMVQTFGTGQSLHLDARILGLGAAITALLLRAPFIVVVLVAAAVAAASRHFGLAL